MYSGKCFFVSVCLSFCNVQVGIEAASVDVTEQDESYNSLLSAPPSHPTWLESRREAVSD